MAVKIQGPMIKTLFFVNSFVQHVWLYPCVILYYLRVHLRMHSELGILLWKFPPRRSSNHTGIFLLTSLRKYCGITGSFSWNACTYPRPEFPQEHSLVSLKWWEGSTKACVLSESGLLPLSHSKFKMCFMGLWIMSAFDSQPAKEVSSLHLLPASSPLF